VLTLGEVAKGSAALSRRDAATGRVLERWLDDMRVQYRDRILSVDAAIAETWGRLSADRPRAFVDTLLAATALVHGMTLVTRNLRDVADTGVKLLNPWETP
jgi:toxin FitB